MQQLLRLRPRTRSGVSQRHISSVKKRMRQSFKRQHTDANAPAAAESSSDSAQAPAPADAASKADSGNGISASRPAESDPNTASMAASSNSSRMESRNAQGAGDDSQSSRSLPYSGLAQPPSRRTTYAGNGRTAEPKAGTEGSAEASAGLSNMSEVSSSTTGSAVERCRVPGPTNAALHAQPDAALSQARHAATARVEESKGWGQRPASMRRPCMRQMPRRPSLCMLPQQMQAKQAPLAQVRFL